MESKELSSRESINQSEIPSEKPLFEIRDPLYLFEQLINIMVCVYAFTVAEIFQPKGLFALLPYVAFTWLIISLVNIIRGPKLKVQFYADRIVARTFGKKKSVSVQISGIKESYRMPISIYFLGLKRFGIIRQILAFLIFILPMLIPALFFTSLILYCTGRSRSLILDHVLLFGSDDKYIIDFPLSMLSQEERESVTKYLKEYLHVDMEEIPKALFFIPAHKEK